MTFRRKNKILAGAALLCVVSAAICGCGSKAGDDSARVISVSFGPQAYLLKNIAGDRFEVNTVLPPGTDPETYDPEVADLMKLNNSEAYFTLSTPGFEEATTERVRNNFPEVKIYDVSEGIDRISGTHADGDDPHLWSSVANARKIASDMTRRLCEIDPEGASAYHHRADSLDSVLVRLDSLIRENLTASGAKGFVMQHPSLSYFARDYGLQQTALETEGKEASPKDLAHRLGEAGKSSSTVLFYESGHNPAQARNVAGMLGIKAVEISLSGEDWADQMLKISRSF